MTRTLCSHKSTGVCRQQLWQKTRYGGPQKGLKDLVLVYILPRSRLSRAATGDSDWPERTQFPNWVGGVSTRLAFSPCGLGWVVLKKSELEVLSLVPLS